MITLRAKAPAKINLALDVLGKRDDGYHNLKMVMASVSLYDDLTVTLTRCEPGREDFSANSDDARLPTDDKNLAVRAARLFLQRNNLAGWSAHVRIEKRIPICAGLGGGSSDAAAVLRVLAGWHPVPEDVLAAWALELGSDVPYCLHGGVCLAEGRGEILTPLPPLPDCWIVLSTPPVAVSTAEAFVAFDTLGAFPIPDGVAEIKHILRDAGARNAVMSGTGPSVFGIFDDEASARQTFDALREKIPNTFLTKPV